MSEKTRSGCLKPVLIGLFGTLLLVLIIVMISLSTVVTKVANDQLPKQLGTEARLGGSQVNLLAGRVALKDLTIQQPEGFKELGGSLLALEELVVNVPLRKAIDQDPMIVRNIRLTGLDLNVISDTNVVINLTKLGPPPKQEPDPVPEEGDEEIKPASIPPIWIKQILLENINIAFQDFERDWGIDLNDMELEFKDIQITDSQIDRPGTVEGHVFFHSKKASGRLMLRAKVGVITPDNPESIPAVQLALGLIGFDLDLVEPFLVPSPAVAKTAFGGSGFDFRMFMQIDPGTAPAEQAISGRFELITDRAHEIDDNLGGTLAEPVLPFTTLFADVLGNQFGRAFKMGGNVAQGGLEAGKAVGKTGVAAAKGVGKTVGGFAGGVLRSAKGVVTLDADEAMGGIGDATVGTAKNAAGAVGDTAGTAGKGLKDTGGTVTGGNDVQKWWADVKGRQEAFEEEARIWFEENPFPSAPASFDPSEAMENEEAEAAQEEEAEEDEDDD